jgi:hypothetical protein
MSEPRKRVGSEKDRKRINLEQEEDVRYWVAELGIDEPLLRELVSVHGHSATIIREVLNRRRVA